MAEASHGYKEPPLVFAIVYYRGPDPWCSGTDNFKPYPDSVAWFAQALLEIYGGTAHLNWANNLEAAATPISILDQVASLRRSLVTNGHLKAKVPEAA